MRPTSVRTCLSHNSLSKPRKPRCFWYPSFSVFGLLTSTCMGFLAWETVECLSIFQGAELVLPPRMLNCEACLFQRLIAGEPKKSFLVG